MKIMIFQTFYIALIVWRLVLISEAHNFTCSTINEIGDYTELIIKNGSKRQNGQYVSDITNVVVVWKRSSNETENLKKFQEVFEHYNIKQIQLNVKTGEEWGSFEPDREAVHFSMYGDFRWNVPRIPCLKQEYQVVAPPYTKEGVNQCFGTKIASFLPASPSEIRNAKYNPKPPMDLRVATGKNVAKVEWNVTACSEENVVLIYESSSDFVLIQNLTIVLSDEHVGYQSTQIHDLNSCSEYSAEVFSKLKNKTIGSEKPSVIDFITEPELDALSHLMHLDIVEDTSSAILTFPLYQEKLKCLDNYALSTCDKTLVCSKPKVFQRNSSNGAEFVNYTAKYTLGQCSYYYIKIESQHSNDSLNPRYISVVSGIDEKWNLSVISKKAKENSIEITLDKIDCIDSFLVSYRTIGESYGPFIKQTFDKRNQIVINNLYSETSYQINITVTVSNSIAKRNLTVSKELHIKTSKYSFLII